MEATSQINQGIADFLVMIPFPYLIMVIITSLIFVPLNRQLKLKREILNVALNSIFWAGVTYISIGNEMFVDNSGITSHLIGAAVACFVVIKLRIPIFNKKLNKTK